MTITELIQRYNAALDLKAELEEQTKTLNANIEYLRGQLADAMVDEDIPSIEHDGYTYSLSDKVKYSKRGDDVIAAEGLDFFEVLRGEGLGDIIVPTVNARTLQSAIKNYVDEHGELPDELDRCISKYEYMDITRRKATRRAVKK